ncbi:MAG: NACHT domain-containing protein [Pyrinomonadaceae bacterium]
MQPKIIHEYHVFLASPGDMEAERREVRKFFEAYNRQYAARWSLRFTVIDWENYATVGVGRPQELITQQTLEKFKDSLALVVGLMGQRFGSPTGTHESGTEEEFEWAFGMNTETGFPEIKWFFRDINKFQASSSEPEKIQRELEQWIKVRSFRERLEKSEAPVFYSTFPDTTEFIEVFREDLLRWLNDDSRPWHTAIKTEVPTSSEVTDLPTAYFETLFDDFRSLDIAGIDNDRAVDIPLSEVYVRLRVIKDEDTLTESDSADGEPIDIHTALRQYQRLVIVGDPGSGKSTFLKFIALMIARAELENDPGLATVKLNLQSPLPVPFFVSLWDLSDFLKTAGQAGEGSVIDFIITQLADEGITLARDTLTRLLDAGSCCLLFDGLDEVPTEQGRALISRLVEKFVVRYENNRFVVTSRVRGYTGDTILKGGFVRCDIQAFDESDREEFLKNWFAALLKVSREQVLAEGSTSRQAYDTLRAAIESKDRIRNLAVNPLLMTVIAIVHWNRKRLPDQRVDLYDECVDVLLGQRKAAERIRRYKPVEALNEAAEEEEQYDRAWTRKRFAEIALRILESGTDEITREVVLSLLKQRFSDRPGTTGERAAVNAEMFLDRQELRSGLLVSRRSHSCRFVHLTFQEYLAAWHLANLSLETIKTTVASRLRNPQWFESLQLLGGELAKNSDEKLDQYVSYLLDNLGVTIAEQAPVIALCANILQDVKGVADIKVATRQKYLTALRNTLHAFKFGSGVPANTQLEVLNALIPLGASVKEHLVEATKSSHYPVRSKAVSMLVPHLPDDDLFNMDHIILDRSQETITVYLSALFERDSKRAMGLLIKNKNKIVTSYKAERAIWKVYYYHQDDINSDLIWAMAKKLVNDHRYTWELMAVLNYFASRPLLGKELEAIIRYWAEHAVSELNRRAAFEQLVRKHLRRGDIKYTILTRDLDDLPPFRDPQNPIDEKWVKQCSRILHLSENRIWIAFKEMSSLLPIKLKP